MNNEMKQRVRNAMRRTWEAIADDVLEIADESTSIGGSFCSRELVIEMVTDADRLTMYGHDKEAAEAYYALPYASDERNTLNLETFPQELYD